MHTFEITEGTKLADMLGRLSTLQEEVAKQFKVVAAEINAGGTGTGNVRTNFAIAALELHDLKKYEDFFLAVDLFEKKLHAHPKQLALVWGWKENSSGEKEVGEFSLGIIGEKSLFHGNVKEKVCMVELFERVRTEARLDWWETRECSENGMLCPQFSVAKPVPEDEDDRSFFLHFQPMLVGNEEVFDWMNGRTQDSKVMKNFERVPDGMYEAVFALGLNPNTFDGFKQYLWNEQTSLENLASRLCSIPVPRNEDAKCEFYRSLAILGKRAERIRYGENELVKKALKLFGMKSKS